MMRGGERPGPELGFLQQQSQNNRGTSTVQAPITRQPPGAYHHCAIASMSLSVRPNDQFITDDDDDDAAARIVSRDATNMDAVRHAQARADIAARRLPAWLKFPLAAFATLSLSTILHSITADYTGPELASVSRVFTAEWQIALMTAYKLAELAAAWYLGYDCELTSRLHATATPASHTY